MKPARSSLIFWSITAALAGFLFGFDTVVISGAEQTIQKLWGLSAAIREPQQSAASDACKHTALGGLIRVFMGGGGAIAVLSQPAWPQPSRIHPRTKELLIMRELLEGLQDPLEQVA